MASPNKSWLKPLKRAVELFYLYNYLDYISCLLRGSIRRKTIKELFSLL